MWQPLLENKIFEILMCLPWLGPCLGLAFALALALALAFALALALGFAFVLALDWLAGLAGLPWLALLACGNISFAGWCCAFPLSAGWLAAG